MNKALILAGKTLTGAGTLVCAVWAYHQPDFEPIACTLTGLGSFLLLFVAEQVSKPNLPIPTMKQCGGKDSTNYQSGGNMTINHKP